MANRRIGMTVEQSQKLMIERLRKRILALEKRAETAEKELAGTKTTLPCEYCGTVPHKPECIFYGYKKIRTDRIVNPGERYHLHNCWRNVLILADRKVKLVWECDIYIPE